MRSSNKQQQLHFSSAHILLLTITQCFVMVPRSRCEESPSAKIGKQNAKMDDGQIAQKMDNQQNDARHGLEMLQDVLPVPILATDSAVPSVAFSSSPSSPVAAAAANAAPKSSQLDNNAVTELVPPTFPFPSPASLWSGTWLQMPGLISVPRLDWAVLEPQPTIGALLTLPTLFPSAAAVASLDIGSATNKNNNNNNNNNNHNFAFSSPFSPAALLAKRDDQQQQQQRQPAVAVAGTVGDKQQHQQNGINEQIEANNRKNNNGTNGTTTAPSAPQFVGIRARFNPPMFEETSRLFFNVFNHEAQHIQIRPQKQCFAEGCFHLHTFRISSFQKPHALTLKPLGPNVLLLNILSFDVDIESLLNGSVQLLITSVPITGNFFVSARQLSITALFDLQKDQHKVPYLRIVTCELRTGLISTKVSNIGLLTDPVNLKYKSEMLDKAKELITSTICETISDTIRDRVNIVLRRMPRAISVAQIINSVASLDTDECQSPPIALQLDGPTSTQQRVYSNQLTLRYSRQRRRRNGRGGQTQRRRRRGLEVIDFETDKSPSSAASTTAGEKSLSGNVAKNKTTVQQRDMPLLTPSAADAHRRDPFGKHSKEQHIDNGTNAKIKSFSADCPAYYAAPLLDFIDMQSFDKVFIDLDFLDSSAGSDFFAVGLSGNVFVRSPMPSSPHVTVGTVEEVVQPQQLNAAAHPSTTTRRRAKQMAAEDEDKSLLADTDGDGLDTDLHQREENNNRNEHQQHQQQPPSMLRFPAVVELMGGGNGYQRKTLEMIVSDHSANLALLQAFRAKMVKVRLGSNSAMFGQMLRTTCGPDEVCLSDSIPEMGEKYPDKQLEVEIEATQAPQAKISKDMVTLHIVGTATFMLSQSGKPIGRIPFTAVVQVGVVGRNSSSSSRTTITTSTTMAKTKEPSLVDDNTGADNTTTTTPPSASAHSESKMMMDISFAIPTLALRDDVSSDFFGLSSPTLESFLDTVRNAIQNSVRRALGSGLSLASMERRLCPFGISQPGVQMLDDGLVLLSAELNAYVLLFDGATGAHCSPLPTEATLSSSGHSR